MLKAHSSWGLALVLASLGLVACSDHGRTEHPSRSAGFPCGDPVPTPGGRLGTLVTPRVLNAPAAASPNGDAGIHVQLESTVPVRNLRTGVASVALARHGRVEGGAFGGPALAYVGDVSPTAPWIRSDVAPISGATCRQGYLSAGDYDAYVVYEDVTDDEGATVSTLVSKPVRIHLTTASTPLEGQPK
jgi:hypothetical protein